MLFFLQRIFFPFFPLNFRYLVYCIIYRILLKDNFEYKSAVMVSLYPLVGPD